MFHIKHQWKEGEKKTANQNPKIDQLATPTCSQALDMNKIWALSSKIDQAKWCEKGATQSESASFLGPLFSRPLNRVKFSLQCL